MRHTYSKLETSILRPFQGLTNRLRHDVGRCPTLLSYALSELSRFQNQTYYNDIAQL